MSCVPCISNEDDIPLEEFDRWTDNISHVLQSESGRSYFKDFLSTRHLDESLITLTFYEECLELLTRFEKQLSNENSPMPVSVAITKFTEEANVIVAKAEDEVNLDLAQLQNLYKAMSSRDVDNLRSAFKEAMFAAQDNLKDHYYLFRKRLIIDRGLQPKNSKTK